MTTERSSQNAVQTGPAEEYPKLVELKNGSTATLRLMAPADAALLHSFFRAIPPEDLLFLRRDVTDRAEIDGWANGVAAGSITTVLALQGDRIVGEASLHLNSTPWTEHVGEVRVVVSSALRQSGLGSRLTSEIFLIAIQRGIRKIVAEMTIEQKSAIAVFQKLGFRVEGLLRNHARDRKGVAHDLVLMGHETQEFYDQMRAYGYEETLDDE